MNFLLLLLSLFLEFVSPGTSEKLINSASKFEESSAQISVEKRVISPAPVKVGTAGKPKTAKAVFAYDLDTLIPLDPSQAIDDRRAIASITKIMTAIVILEREDPERVVTVPELNLLNDESRMGLITGEKIKIKELLYGVLVPSGSDAARTLAQSYPGGEKAFLDEMNATARRIGLTNTNFSNPVGLDDKDNYSTARDLGLLTRYALRNSFFRSAVALKTYTARSEDGRVHRIFTTNQLLDGKTVLGVKTGRTEEAGECLIILSKLNGHEIITIILGSDDRFGETSALISGINKSYDWEQ